jgi:hypothetical protein
MSTSDVRSIESLERFRAGILGLAENWDHVLQELRISIQRAEQHFGDHVPRYWRHQVELAEGELTEAKNELQRKQAAARGGDRVSALEAQKRVSKAKKRLDLCRQRQRTARSLAIEIKHQCDEMLAPLADMTDHSEKRLPAAAAELANLLEKLHRYAESTGPPPADTSTNSPNSSTVDASDNDSSTQSD